MADEFNQKDFLNDFATEEFITKNIRVRPVSGATQNAEKEEQKSDIFGNRTLLGGETGNQMDEETKFNHLVDLEMEIQRKNVK